MITDFAPGQRWTSEMEPELGMGIVEAIDGRRVTVTFPKSGLTRTYAIESAPLRRVVFHPGDRIAGDGGVSLTIAAIETEDGLNVYCGDGGRLREDRLADTLTVNRPADRLMAAQRDALPLFDLRVRLLDHRHRTARSPVHGFVGGRVELIAHQFAIAAEVSSRRFPRVLLADETGLGKTIEAGLILHRLTTTGRVGRVLIVVPDALVVQWYVELARRFNLRFRILDDAAVKAQSGDPAGDASLDDEPLCLCGFAFLAGAPPAMRRQLMAGGWDMVVVDEAHRMRPGDDLFGQVQGLAHTVRRLILISATPGQLSARSHFERLRLLDPDRYGDYRQFQMENREFGRMADLVQAVAQGDGIDPAAVDALSRLLGVSPDRVARTLARPDADGARRRLVRTLVDRFGTGRAMFRTSRSAVSGFPGRTVHLVPLDAGGKGMRGRLNTEFLRDCGTLPQPEDVCLEDDPRVRWLTAFLREHRDEKTLLLCRSPQKVNALLRSLEKETHIRIGRFHEGMTLVQRDRNAAWFAEPDGAVLLVCSEIGSEGRNFQFARRLVLFDLPADPELLEQRIGRLDRIGQTGVVRVMVPYVRRTAGEVMARWYHEALNAFERYAPAAAWVTKRFMGALMALTAAPGPGEADARLARLIRGGRIAADRQRRRIEAGRDRLMALDRWSPEETGRLIETIRRADADSAFQALVEALLDHCGIVMEPVDERVFRLMPDHRYAQPLPGFRPSGIAVTTDRSVALTREDLGFLTWDHPLVAGAMDLFLGSGKGNVAFSLWPASGPPAFFMEMVFLLEAGAPPDLCLDRFLPPTPIRVVVDHQLEDRKNDLPDVRSDSFADGSAALFAQTLPAVSHRIPDMVDAGRAMARARALPVIEAAHRAAGLAMEADVQRLEALGRVNTAIGDEEINAARAERDALLAAVSTAVVRLDAMRLIVKARAD
ncbi:RNA polymerase-associated protein RapA [Desulfosarcina alkanivorans]|uniref:RNA polymerase-associated protein RapA n=1 Tax=Desulfosarcina alkanivorans TaxID=571177 RepID=A0A5K7YJQ0_9BACT|nr:RNA polymerase-associated protein RapA [Desulfosarcina alkanivorans]BBO68733.1 RNA polymerase-associated protein RapA [Desulfosarcina alkanivorans]